MNPNAKPKLSYTIWFTQRTGSTLLCRALADTGVAGHPAEWLQPSVGQSLMSYYGVNSPAAFRRSIFGRWAAAATECLA